MSVDPLDARLAEINARLERDRSKRPAYTDPSTWKRARDQQGHLSAGVIASSDGRYTIVQTQRPGDPGPSYLAFRRQGPPECAKWSPPAWVEWFPSPEAARAGCAEHARREVAS